MWNKRNRRVRTSYTINKKGLYAVITGITVLFIGVLGFGAFALGDAITDWRSGGRKPVENLTPPAIEEQLLAPNEYSRPGTGLADVRGIVIHYTANPGTSAMANRNYFNNLPKLNKKKTDKTYASSHFVVGIEGEIVQCIPLNEIAYASNERNADTISVECCHRRKSGRFTRKTYASLVELTVYLCKRYGLSEGNVIRHYDVTGKNCPKYFVEHEDAWRNFLTDVAVGIKTEQ